MSKAEWLRLYFSMSDEDPKDVLARFDVVRCNCDDPHCHGWKLELKEPRHD